MPSGVQWNGVPSCPPCLNQQAFLQAWYLVPGSGTIAWFSPPPLPFRLPPSPSPAPNYSTDVSQDGEEITSENMLVKDDDAFL